MAKNSITQWININGEEDLPACHGIYWFYNPDRKKADLLIYQLPHSNKKRSEYRKFYSDRYTHWTSPLEPLQPDN